MKEGRRGKRYYSFDGAMKGEDTVVEPERRRDDDMVPPVGPKPTPFFLFQLILRFGEEDELVCYIPTLFT